MRALGFVSKNVDTEIDELARTSVARFQAYKAKQGDRISSEEAVRNLDFHTTFLRGLNDCINKRITVLNQRLEKYEDELYELLSQKKIALENLRKTEARLSKLEKEAKEHNIFIGLAEGVVKASKRFVKNTAKLVGTLTVDLLSGEIPLSLDAITNRLQQDLSDLAFGAVSDVLNVVFTEALIAAQQAGGIVEESVVFLAESASEIINVSCSGPVLDSMNTAKNMADSTMATPGSAFSEYCKKKGKGVSQAIVDDMNSIAKPYNIKSLITQGSFEKPPKELESAIDSIDADDAGKTVFKEGLSIAGTTFPPLKMGAAFVSGVSTTYGSFCDNMSDMPVLQALEARSKNPSQSMALDAKKVAALENEITANLNEYENQNQKIISNLNSQTATMMELVQYSFSSSWLMKSCWQLKSLRKAYPYMSNEEIVTLFFGRIGNSDFLKIKNLLTINMFSFILRGFYVFVSEEIKTEPETCPLIDQELAYSLNQRWGLTKKDYCQHMSRLEVRQLIEEYQEAKSTIKVPKKTTETLEQFVAKNKEIIRQRIAFFNKKYFSDKNLFNSFAIEGRDIDSSSLNANTKAYYKTKLQATPLNLGAISEIKENKLKAPSEVAGDKNVSLNIMSKIALTSFVALATLYIYKKKRGRNGPQKS